jgi:hypothetical protein
MLCSIVQINLIGSDAEAADNHQVLCLTQDIRRKLCFRADTDGVDATVTPSLARVGGAKHTGVGVGGVEQI